MGYVKKNLMQGEEIFVLKRLHWTIFTKPILCFAAAAALLIYSLKIPMAGDAQVLVLLRYAGFLLLIPALWYFADSVIKRQSTEFAVTSKRVIAKYGVIKQSTIELNHSKVESFHVEQGVLGRLLGFGALHINGTGGGITHIEQISDPLGFRRGAMQAIDASQNNFSGKGE